MQHAAAGVTGYCRRVNLAETKVAGGRRQTPKTLHGPPRSSDVSAAMADCAGERPVRVFSPVGFMFRCTSVPSLAALEEPSSSLKLPTMFLPQIQY